MCVRRRREVAAPEVALPGGAIHLAPHYASGGGNGLFNPRPAIGISNIRRVRRGACAALTSDLARHTSRAAPTKSSVNTRRRCPIVTSDVSGRCYFSRVLRNRGGLSRRIAFSAYAVRVKTRARPFTAPMSPY
ncbi:hypothetical protein EVAR_637_1 [Eumeta japonica]|uniref:Uncharacterized protein n=1 Tax=Eumeta variegata TaxID=151549 RepID=A0A4C1SDG8_EUMVA|nr:hypothetical protein EVAR_637_1 [Eumeta japonica]